MALGAAGPGSAAAGARAGISAGPKFYLKNQQCPSLQIIRLVETLESDLLPLDVQSVKILLQILTD